MKKTFKLCSLLLSFVFAFSLFALVACNNGNESNGGGDSEVPEPPAHTHTFAKEWSKDAEGHWHASTCGHTDEPKQPHDGNPCTVCGYTKEALVSHYFETEDPHLDSCGGEMVRIASNPYAPHVRYEIVDSDVGAPTMYSFNLDAEKAGSAKILFKVRKRTEELDLSSELQLIFNDDEIALTQKIPVLTTDESNVAPIFGFIWVELADVQLKAGQNTIDLIPVLQKSNFCIDKIDVQSAGNIGWFDDGMHYCEHWCPDCRGCLDPECTEEVCVTKGATAGSIRKKNQGGKCAAGSSSDNSSVNTNFEAEDERAILTDGATVVPASGDASGYVSMKKGSSITFNFTMLPYRQCCGFRFSVSKLAERANFQDYFRLEIDGVDLNEYGECERHSPIAALTAGETAGTTFTIANLGCIFLYEGNHVAKLTALTDTDNLFVDYMFLVFRHSVTWTEA